MQFSQHAHVYTVDRHPVGHITHVVLDPDTREVTHVVVRRGIVFIEDKVVPIHMFETTCPEGAILREHVGDLHDLPKFEEAQYVQMDMLEDMASARTAGEFGVLYLVTAHPNPERNTAALEKRPKATVQQHVRARKQNIPAGEIAMKEGAWVMSTDDRHVGNVESVLVDPQTNQVTSVVIARQGLLKRLRKLIPVAWIRAVGEDRVYLTVKEAELKSLPDCG